MSCTFGLDFKCKQGGSCLKNSSCEGKFDDISGMLGTIQGELKKYNISFYPETITASIRDTSD